MKQFNKWCSTYDTINFVQCYYSMWTEHQYDAWLHFNKRTNILVEEYLNFLFVFICVLC